MVTKIRIFTSCLSLLKANLNPNSSISAYESGGGLSDIYRDFVVRDCCYNSFCRNNPFENSRIIHRRRWCEGCDTKLSNLSFVFPPPRKRSIVFCIATFNVVLVGGRKDMQEIINKHDVAREMNGAGRKKFSVITLQLWSSLSHCRLRKCIEVDRDYAKYSKEAMKQFCCLGGEFQI